MSLLTTDLPNTLDLEPRTFLVQFDVNQSEEALTAGLATIGAKAVSTITPAHPDEGRGPLLLVEMLSDQAPAQSIETLSRLPGVAFAEVNAQVAIADMAAPSSDQGFVGAGMSLSGNLALIANPTPSGEAAPALANVAPDGFFSPILDAPQGRDAAHSDPIGLSADADASIAPPTPGDQAELDGDHIWTAPESPDTPDFADMSWFGALTDVQMNVTVEGGIIYDKSYLNGSQWGMYGDKTAVVNPYGSQAGEAWAAGFTGKMTTVVGVIDTGVDYTHPDLYRNIWLNQGEIPQALVNAGLSDRDSDDLITFRDLNDSRNAAYVTDLNKNGYIDAGDLLKDARWANKTDDDGNQKTDDLIGWDFINNDNDPFDDNGHGTHVSGVIGAMGGNGVGVNGVNWDVQIVAMKFLAASGAGSVSGAVKAINYFTEAAIDASIAQTNENFVATNNSWGGPTNSQALSDAVTKAAQEGILFIAAAGNGSVNTDATGNYPSNLSTNDPYDPLTGYDAVISVASLTNAGTLSSFSNYGAETVDLAAPGSNIYSTLPGGAYGTMSGTSMATPFVTGAVALYASAHPELFDASADPKETAYRIRDALLESTNSTASLNGVTVTGGRLDIGNLLNPILQPVDIIGGTSTTASLINTTQSSTIDFAGDQDWFRLAFTSGNRYDFVMTPRAASSLDGYLRLLDANGMQIIVNEDPFSANSRLSFIATTSGTYYISAQGNQSSMGAYALSMAETLAPTVINGTSGNDALIGGRLNETLNGYGGNDTLDGGAGVDTMIGGIGDDVYYVDNSSDLIVEQGTQGADRVFATVSYILSSGVENLTLTGSANLDGGGNALNNLITGNTGKNIIDGKEGVDTMIGGAGDDTYYVETIGDTIVENASAGNDTVYASINYTLAANVEALVLQTSSSINGTGNAVNNTIIGNNGNNVIDGGGGADWMEGRLGNDTYVVDHAGDYVYEDIGAGTDAVMASISYMLTGNVESLTLTGSAAINGFGNSLNNVINGNSSNNYLDGGAGQDSLVGGVGNDTLNGGLGNDMLDGGAGADFFVFNSTLGSANIDRIAAFSVVDDTIYLAQSIFNAFGGYGAIAAGAFNTTSAPLEADDRIIFNKTTGDLFYDADGSGRNAAVQFATLANVTGTMSAKDFVVI